MSYGGTPQPALALPRPGRALKAVLIALFAIWLAFALAVNWGGASGEIFRLFIGNPEALLSGQAWRLVTPLMMHAPSGSISHILVALLGLYFLGHSLEEAWGGRRFIWFLLLSGVGAYTVQFGASLVLPAYLAQRLLPYSEAGGVEWFGALPVVEAIAIAWALSFKGRTILLFFVLPVSSRGLLLLVLGGNLLMVIAGVPNISGHVASFGGMFFGWLLGGGTPSPARRFFLKAHLAQLQSEQRRIEEARRERLQRSKLRVIKGGQDDDDDGPDGKWLN